VISRDTVRQISLPTCAPGPALLSASPFPNRKLSISGYIAPGQHRVRAIQQRRLYWALFLEPGGGRHFFLLFPENLARSLITFQSPHKCETFVISCFAAPLSIDLSIYSAARNLFSCGTIALNYFRRRRETTIIKLSANRTLQEKREAKQRETERERGGEKRQFH